MKKEFFFTPKKICIHLLKGIRHKQKITEKVYDLSRRIYERNTPLETTLKIKKVKT